MKDVKKEIERKLDDLCGAYCDIDEDHVTKFMRQTGIEDLEKRHSSRSGKKMTKIKVE